MLSTRKQNESNTEVEFDDLGATVYPASVPDGLPEAVDRLYGSLFSTVDWFVTHDDALPEGACVLREPRHVILFRVRGDTVEVLNKAFEIAPRDAWRACAALFRAFPRARRIHIEVMFPPEQLRAPMRVRYTTDHMIVELPDTEDEYYRSLGKSMRRNLRSATNRLRREHSDAETTVIEPRHGAQGLLDEFLEWKRARFHDLGRTTYWDDDPRLMKRFADLLGRRGEAHILTIDGRRAAINFIFPVGDTFCAQESSFDPQYTRVDLGLLSQYDVALDAIRRGARRMNMLWGSEAHKRHFGAVAHRASALSVFRNQSARLWSPEEALEVHRRRLRKASAAYYWKARHTAGARLRAARRRGAGLRASTTDDAADH
jgi:CelD/BcsL family acetyltransferase involved in cellulose biosynthesis